MNCAAEVGTFSKLYPACLLNHICLIIQEMLRVRVCVCVEDSELFKGNFDRSDG